MIRWQMSEGQSKMYPEIKDVPSRARAYGKSLLRYIFLFLDSNTREGGCIFDQRCTFARGYARTCAREREHLSRFAGVGR